MKRFIAGFVALMMIMSLGACGNNDSDEKTGHKKSEKGTATQSAVSNDISDKSEIDSSDEFGIETQLKDLLQKKIDAAVNDDFDTFCGDSIEKLARISIKFNIAEGQYNENEVTHEMKIEYEEEIYEKYEGLFDLIRTVVNSDNYDNYEITNCKMEEYEKKDGLGVYVISFNFNNNESDTHYAKFFEADAEVELKELEFNYEEISDLKNANSNAKTVYNAAAEYLYDMDTKGYSMEDILYESGGEIDCNASAYSNELSEIISECVNDNGYSGIVYIGASDDGFFVQWKSSYDSETVGQYPNPNGDENNQYTWGYYGNYQ